ncbi:hypothetical protein DFH27DRAFT_191294 [Peziza echinospora]|nr:hypothetical protein DFH27DRAFT_191294 [Peziza echinospora]
MHAFVFFVLLLYFAFCIYLPCTSHDFTTSNPYVTTHDLRFHDLRLNEFMNNDFLRRYDYPRISLQPFSFFPFFSLFFLFLFLNFFFIVTQIDISEAGREEEEHND